MVKCKMLVMPAKFRVKDYRARSFYHIYNRGIEGRVVFEQESDFKYFESLLERYLLGPGEKAGTKMSAVKFRRGREMALAGQLDLVAYCLMPDHFHLLVYQEAREAMMKFMRRLMTGYVMYFNRRRGRSGPLFETNYRAVRVEDLRQAAVLVRYIHLNPASVTVKRFGPVETVTGTNPIDYPYSSFGVYVGLKSCLWVKKLYVTGELGELLTRPDRARKEEFEVIKQLTIDS